MLLDSKGIQIENLGLTNIKEIKMNSNFVSKIDEVKYDLYDSYKIDIPVVNADFDVKEALGNGYDDVLLYLSTRTSYKDMSAYIILEDLEKRAVNGINGDIMKYLKTSNVFLKKFTTLLGLLENDGEKIIKGYTKKKDYINNTNELSKEEKKEMEKYVLYIKEKCTEFRYNNLQYDNILGYLKKNNFDELINYFLKISTISVEEFNSKLCTFNEEDFNYLVEKILNLDLYKTLKVDIIFLLIVMRNLFMIYIPLFNSIYNHITKNNNYNLDFYLSLIDEINDRYKIVFNDFGNYIYLLWYNLNSLDDEFKNIKKLNNIGKLLGLDNLDYLYINYESKLDVSNLEILYKKGLLIKLKDYLDINPKGFIDYIDFVSLRVFQEHHGMIKFVDIADLDYYKERIKGGNLSNEEKAFVVEYGFLDREDKIIKSLLFLSKNINLDKNDLSNLTDEQVLILKENYQLPLSFLKRFILGEDIEILKKENEVENWKTEILEKISIIPNVIGFENIFFSIKEKMKQIDLESFEKQKTEIEKLFKNNLEPIYKKVKKLLEYGKLNLDKIHDFINLFLSKASKKNGLKLNSIVEILEFLLKKYEDYNILFFENLLKKDNLSISPNFIDDYKKILGTILSNTNIIDKIIENNNINFHKIYEIISSSDIKRYKLSIINTYFSEDLEQEILDFSEESSDLFNKLVTIAKIIDLKNNEDLILELITLSLENFKKFYFLIKNLHILGIGLEDKKYEILQIILNGYFIEEKLIKVKPLLKNDLDNVDKDFFYNLFMEYVISNDMDISIFEILFEVEENIESDEEFEKNTGIKGLSGWSGKNIVKKFEKLGFSKKRVNGKEQGKGDHILMYKEDSNGKLYTMVPMHKTLKAKTLFDTLNRAKISKEKLFNI